jgi:hypothetical protein
MPPKLIDVLTIGVTIRILFYCDDLSTNTAVVPQPGPGNQLRGNPTEFGLRILKDLLESQSTFLVRLRVDVVNRNYQYGPDGFVREPAVPGANKLTAALLKKYDQVWFFGQHYANYSRWNEVYGGPESELTDPEVAGLRTWMDAGGGVFMSGDHSNDVTANDQFLVNPALKSQTLNLGRALGWRVPRAGLMRVWVGAPDSGAPGYYVDTAADPNMAMMPKQEDATPQTIRIEQVVRFVHMGTTGVFGPVGWVFFDDHPLFRTTPNADYPSSTIDILPDHVHEGAVAIPRTLDPALWPAHGSYRPGPQIVAWGTNKAPLRWGSFRRSVAKTDFNLWREVGSVAAYDGDYVGVGRIVAHSTWHHCVNVNLVGFRNPDGSAGKVLRRLGEYFKNVALWLSPWAARNKLLFAAIDWTARHPYLREITGAPAHALGASAASLMGRALGAGTYDDLMQLPFAALVPHDGPDGVHAAIPHELLLGTAIGVAQQRAAAGGNNDVALDAETMNDIAREAVTTHHRSLVREAKSLEACLHKLRSQQRGSDKPGARPPTTARKRPARP